MSFFGQGDSGLPGPPCCSEIAQNRKVICPPPSDGSLPQTSGLNHPRIYLKGLLDAPPQYLTRRHDHPIKCTATAIPETAPSSPSPAGGASASSQFAPALWCRDSTTLGPHRLVR